MRLDEVFLNTIPSVVFPVLFESTKVGREYNHLENLLIIKGSDGGIEALNELKEISRNPAVNVNMKWDGIAAIFWGRDDQGNFVFLPLAQWKKGQRLDKQGLVSEILRTGKPKTGQSQEEFSQTRKAMADRYSRLWDIFERATPVNFRGYLNGDIMFSEPQDIRDNGYYEFTPNKVTYRVRPNGLFGKMTSAQAFVTVHGKIDKIGATATGNLVSQPDAYVQQFNKNPQLIVLPTQHPQVRLSNINALSDSAIAFIQKNSSKINSIVNYEVPQFRSIKKILYDYSNKLARAGGKLDFDTWLLSSKLSDNQKDVVKMLIKAKPDGWEAFWSAFTQIQKIKNTVVDELNAVHGKYMDSKYGISAFTNGKPGGEGYVRIMKSGDMGKLVNPEYRAAPDNHRYRPVLSEDTNVRHMAVWTFARMNPPHYGHRALIDTIKKEAETRDADWYLFVSKKQEPLENPLDYEQKIYWLLKLFPDLEGHLIRDPSISNLLTAGTWLYKNGYRSAVFVAGEDDLPKYGKSIQDGSDYGKNNPELLPLGKAFTFSPLFFAESPRLATASNARADAKKKDREAFARDILGPEIDEVSKENPELVNSIKNELMDEVHYGMTHLPNVKKKKKVTESFLLETNSDEIDPSNRMGGWINAITGDIHYTSDTSEFGTAHISLARDLGIDTSDDDDYDAVYNKHFVRFGCKNYPRSIELSGRLEDLKRTFGNWFYVAQDANELYIDIESGSNSEFRQYHMNDKSDLRKLRQEFEGRKSYMKEEPESNTPKDKNYGIYKGRRFWSGIADTMDGHIREVHPYERARAADFHHSYYISMQSQDAMKEGQAIFFWMEPDGSISTDWREGQASPELVRLIKKNLENNAHKTVKSVSEAEIMDKGNYGAWINATTGKVTYVPQSQTHMAVANTLGIPMEHETDYQVAYDDHYVRVAFDTIVRGGILSLSGYIKDLKKTYRIWYKTAITCGVVYIDVEQGPDSGFQSYMYDMDDPKSKGRMRFTFSPQPVAVPSLAENDSEYEVVNHYVFGKVLGRGGKVIVTDYDSADDLASKFEGSSLIKIRQGRYVIKLSEQLTETLLVNRIFKYYADAEQSYGWLSVKFSDLEDLGLMPSDFPVSSRRKGATAYLGKGKDIEVFIKTFMKATGKEPLIVWKESPKLKSNISNYPRLRTKFDWRGNST